MERVTDLEAYATPLVVPARVRAARELRGLTQAETVERTEGKLTAAALSQIETGKTRPSPQTLLALAEALLVPSGFFSAHWPSTGLGKTPFFRHLRATPSKDKRRAAALLLVLSDLVAAIETKTRLPPVAVPRHEVGSSPAPEAIIEVATHLRTEWRLGDDPIPHVVRAMERHGIVVARLTLDTVQVDAFSGRSYDRPLVLLGDDKQSYVRSRFDAAHELAHVVMHDEADSGSQEVETQAHEFASNLLLPDHVARTVLPKSIDSSAWQRLAELKRVWGLSIGALLFRARRLGLPELEYRNAMKYMAAQGWRRAEPGDREMGPPESPLLLERAIRTVELDTSLEAFLAESHLPEAETLQLIAAARDRRPVVEF